MKKILYLLTISVLALTSCSGPQIPDFKRVDNIRIHGIKGNVYTIKADAVYHNPNSIGGDLTGMDMVIYVDGKEVSQLEQTKQAVIQPESDFTVPIVFDVDMEKLLDKKEGFLKGVLNKLLKDKLEVHYKGNLHVKFLKVEFKVPVDYTEEVSLLNVE
jgi:LEA14-like dessication related protein